MLSLRSTLLSLSLAATVLPLTAQQSPHPRTAYPYIFDNFIWWSDADLRAALKHRLPTLGDEIVPLSPTESKVRLALTELLKTKGIQADVQSTEPGPPPPPFTNFSPAGIYSPNRKYPQPLRKPSIVFQVASPPYIQAGPVTVEGAPPELLQAVEDTTRPRGDPRYTSGHLGSDLSLRRLFDDSGYFTATIAFIPGPFEKPDATHYLVPVTVKIDPGPRFQIGAIAFDGGPLFKGVDLSSYVTARPGNPVEARMFQQLASSLRSAYQQAGYQYADVDTQPTLDKGHALASYNIKVDPGPLYHFRTITVKNLDATQEQIVRDMLDIHPGDVFTNSKVDRLYQKVAEDPRFKGLGFNYTGTEDPKTFEVDTTLTFDKK